MADLDTLLSFAGPLLAGYLDDPSLIEMMCNPNGSAFVNRFGQGMTEVDHPGRDALQCFLAAIAHETGQEFTAASPRLAAALEDIGWRIQAGCPPEAPGLYMSLRKHPKQIFPLDDFEAKGIITPTQRRIVEDAMQANQRIVIAGGVGSSKTSFTNALLHSIRDSQERIVILEDQPELHCEVRNCVQKRVIKGQWTLRDLVEDALRLNMDRLVVGEVRGPEAWAMLQAFETGHGGMTTVHVDKVEHTMERIEQLVQMVSLSAQEKLIGRVIDLVVHMQKYGTGWRCTGILRLEGWSAGQYQFTPLGE